MKILWLTKQVPYPPAYGGDVIYTRHLVEGCARLGAKIHVICQSNGDDDYDFAGANPNITWEILSSALRSRVAATFSRFPNIGARYDTRAHAASLERAIASGDWDAIVFDTLAPAAKIYRTRQQLALSKSKPCLVYFSTNHEESVRHTLAREARNIAIKVALFLDAWKTRRLERHCVEYCDLITVVTEDDRVLFSRTFPKQRYLVITPGYDGGRARERDLTELGRTVIILGSYQWIAKRLNLEAFLDAATAVFPPANIELRIVGFMDPIYRAQLTRRYSWAVIVGPVNDAQRELAKARIGVVAEHAGGGFKLKVLDYVFNRVAIAALPEAMNGLPFRPNVHYIAEPTMEQLAQAIAREVDRTENLRAMADAAFALCETQYDWDRRCAALLDEIAALKAAKTLA